jgi:hypothetical protein
VFLLLLKGVKLFVFRCICITQYAAVQGEYGHTHINTHTHTQTHTPVEKCH